MRLLKQFSCRAIVFDKDGTLIDTESINYEMYDRLLAPYGVRHTPEVHGRMMGKSGMDCLRVLQASHATFPQGEEPLSRLRDVQCNLYAKVERERGVRPMPGAVALLKRCRAEGIPIALATTSTRFDTDAHLASLKWESIFDAVVTGDDVKSHKPHPETYLRAAELLGIPPEECLAVEDSPNGVASAVAAGMQVIFVCDPRFGLPCPEGVALKISSLEELLV